LKSPHLSGNVLQNLLKKSFALMYAEPRIVTDLSQCQFYHAMDLPGGQFGCGNWDLRTSFEKYTGNVEFAGKRVLDVGTASGFLTFEAEKRGAEVVSFDSASPNMHAGVPFLEVRRRGGTPIENDFDAIRNAYWYAHRAYSSRAKCYYGDVYHLPDELGQFDIVLVGAILCHLRDPVGALTSIARRSRRTLVITEPMVESREPFMSFLPRPSHANNAPHNTWWHLSVGLYGMFLEILGFKIVHYAQNDYPWQNAVGVKTAFRLGTIGAVRFESVV
jgi:SAM-dependent methyltransferase